MTAAVAAPVAPAPARPARPGWHRWLWAACGPVAYAAAQFVLEAARAGRWPSFYHRTWEDPAWSIAAYAGPLIVALVMAVAAPRWWWVPVVCLAVGPALVGQSVQPLSWAWIYPDTRAWVAGRWLAVAFDWAAVAGPAWAVARHRPTRAPACRQRDRAAVGTAALAITVVVMCSYGLALGAGQIDGTGRYLPAACAVLVAAMAARPAARAVLAVGALLVADPFLLVAAVRDTRWTVWSSIPQQLDMSSWPVRVVATAWLAGTLWPAATRLWRRGGPVVWLVALNAANLADAVLTVVAVGAGRAVEANPVVAWAGLPAKLAIGLAASAGLARWRPGWLRWLTLVLFAVLAWHLAGALAGGAGPAT